MFVCAEGNLLPQEPLRLVTPSFITPPGQTSCAPIINHTPCRQPSRFWLEGVVCLCAHVEIMKWLVRGFGQVSWWDRGAPAIKAVLKENISQCLWYLGDSLLLFKGQGMLLASVKKAILSKKDHQRG